MQDGLIRTARLDLISLQPEEFPRLPSDGLSDQVWARRGLTNPCRHLVDDPGPLPHRVPKVIADPAGTPYYLRLAVLRDHGVIVGSAGFHDRPDEDGMVEIGLGIEPPFRRQGFGREVLHGMWGWVVDQPGIYTLRYTVGVSNAASQALVKTLGFRHVGVQIDDEDGPEDIYEMPATQYRYQFMS